MFRNFFYPVDFRKKEAFHLSAIFVTSAILHFDVVKMIICPFCTHDITTKLVLPSTSQNSQISFSKKFLIAEAVLKYSSFFFYLPKLLYESIRPEVFKPRKMLQKIFVMTYSLWKCTIFRILYYINIRKGGLQVR